MADIETTFTGNPAPAAPPPGASARPGARPGASPGLDSAVRTQVRTDGWRAVRVQAAALVLAMGLFLGGGIIAATHVTESIDQLVHATTTARQQAVAAQAVLSALKDAETGQRGFLLTGRPYYLEPYYATISHIDTLLDRLTVLGKGAPWLEQRNIDLVTAARQKVAELRRTVAIAQRDGLPAALVEVKTDAGKAYMDQVRAITGQIIERAESERASRALMLQQRQRLVTDLLLGGLGAGVVLLGAAALLLLWNRTRLLRARAGETLEASRLQAAVEHVPDGVAVFGRDGRLTLVNARFAQTLGVPPALAQPGTLLQQVAAAVSLDPPLLDSAAPAAPVAIEARQGARSLEVWRSQMPDGGQMLAVADVTRRVAAEEEARQSQKMEVLGQMTGGVAHDFNNLLQVVSANLELLRTKLCRQGAAGVDNTAMLARLDAAVTGVARGARLTRHLLAFARRQPLAPEPVDAARLVAGMEEMLRRTLGEMIGLELVVGGGLWFMRADPTQFENALLNLALNARDAMEGPDGLPKGRITIEAANTSLDDAYAARVAEVSPGQYVMFAVTDTGCGMTPDEVSRATEPFYTTKQEGRGTGLGLPMVLGFAKQSGGHFQLYSEPGRGTTARLYIPRTTAPDTRPEPPAPSLPVGRKELVLLVEDDEGVRQAALDALKGLDYRVIEAETADQALALLEDGCRPQLIFTDVVMPGQVSARQMVARAQALVPGVAVLFTSGYTQNSIVHNGQLDADVTLLSKPWRLDALARAVRAALDGTRTRALPRRRVLLVEDDEMVRMATADALAELGFDVLQAPTAAAALARLHPPPDLMLTDLGLPDQNGIVLVAEARRRIPGLPVVVASGESEPPEGDLIWLAKPYDVADLRNAVAKALR